MASCSKEDDSNSSYSLSLTTEETGGTLISPPPLPCDMIAEILCRLPVTQLLQLRCLSKSFNSLISDPNFTKKHLHMSNKRHHLVVSTRNYLDELLLFDSPISSVLSTSTIMQTQLSLPIPISLPKHYSNVITCAAAVCSCDGILCINPCVYDLSAILWNPSIGKFKILPPLENTVPDSLYSFGYDCFIDNYKVNALSCRKSKKKYEVSVLTLGTYHWRRIHDFSFGGLICGPGIFANGTVNWLASDDHFGYAIVSLDLKNESYQMLSQPDVKSHFCTSERSSQWKLGLLRDCLCIFVSNTVMFLDVWIMKEYGNKESWTKLHRFPYLSIANALYIFEDDKMLIDFLDTGSNKRKFYIYDSKIGTFSIHKVQNNSSEMNPNVYIESLISP